MTLLQVRRPSYAEPTMTLSVRGSQTSLRCAGELDLAVRADLAAACRRALEQPGRSLVVDLAGVDLLDCASARLIHQLLDRARDRGTRVSLVCPDGPVHRVLLVVGRHGGLLRSAKRERCGDRAS